MGNKDLRDGSPECGWVVRRNFLDEEKVVKL